MKTEVFEAREEAYKARCEVVLENAYALYSVIEVARSPEKPLSMPEKNEFLYTNLVENLAEVIAQNKNAAKSALDIIKNGEGGVLELKRFLALSMVEETEGGSKEKMLALPIDSFAGIEISIGAFGAIIKIPPVIYENIITTSGYDGFVFPFDNSDLHDAGKYDIPSFTAIISNKITDLSILENLETHELGHAILLALRKVLEKGTPFVPNKGNSLDMLSLWDPNTTKPEILKDYEKRRKLGEAVEITVELAQAMQNDALMECKDEILAELSSPVPMMAGQMALVLKKGGFYDYFNYMGVENSDPVHDVLWDKYLAEVQLQYDALDSYLKDNGDKMLTIQGKIVSLRQLSPWIFSQIPLSDWKEYIDNILIYA